MLPKAVRENGVIKARKAHKLVDWRRDVKKGA